MHGRGCQVVSCGFGTLGTRCELPGMLILCTICQLTRKQGRRDRLRVHNEYPCVHNDDTGNQGSGGDRGRRTRALGSVCASEQVALCPSSPYACLLIACCLVVSLADVDTRNVWSAPTSHCAQGRVFLCVGLTFPVPFRWVLTITYTANLSIIATMQYNAKCLLEPLAGLCYSGYATAQHQPTPTHERGLTWAPRSSVRATTKSGLKSETSRCLGFGKHIWSAARVTVSASLTPDGLGAIAGSRQGSHSRDLGKRRLNGWFGTDGSASLIPSETLMGMQFRMQRQSSTRRA